MGAPQGTVLAPFLFTLYTADCRHSDSSCPMNKFADNSEITGEIKNDDDSVYMEEINSFVKWSVDNHLHLNVSKMKRCVLILGKTEVTQNLFGEKGK